jgi:hypothetical protein
MLGLILFFSVSTPSQNLFLAALSSSVTISMAPGTAVMFRYMLDVVDSADHSVPSTPAEGGVGFFNLNSKCDAVVWMTINLVLENSLVTESFNFLYHSNPTLLIDRNAIRKV